MAIIKYEDSFLGDFFDWVYNDGTRNLSYTRCHLYNPEKYDLVPKDSYKRELIEQKEKELKLLDDKKKLLEEDVKKLKSG